MLGLIFVVVTSDPLTHDLSTLSLSLSLSRHLLRLSAAFGTWSQRVRFKNSEPMLDSSLVIMSTEVSDEGKYLCRITTFPSGTFDRDMSVVVWSESPVFSLLPLVAAQ